jgi:GDPmannose 4,6-dehydratase
MMSQSKPGDYVIGTGESQTVREFVESTFDYAGLDAEKYIKIDPRYFRPTEVEHLVADPRKAKHDIDWNPKIKFKELVKIMVDADMRAVGLEPIGEGDAILSDRFSDRWWTGD